MTCARDSGDFWEKKEQMASWGEKRSMLNGHVWVSHIGSGDMRKERADYIGGKIVNAEWTRVQETHDKLSIVLILILMVSQSHYHLWKIEIYYNYSLNLVIVNQGLSFPCDTLMMIFFRLFYFEVNYFICP